MDYQEFPAPSDLSDVVACAWTLRADAGPREPSSVLPDGHPELVLNFGAPMVHHPIGGDPVEQPRVVLAGVIVRPFHLSATGVVDLLGIRMQPAGARPLAQHGMHALVDTWGEPDSCDAWMDLRQQLTPTASPLRPAAIWTTVRERLGAGRQPPNDAVVRAANRIVRSRGEISAQELAHRVGLGVRQLRRRFREEVGVGPKMLSRVARFQHALREMTGPRAVSASRAAVAAGYTDQAHMISDVSDFSGLSPGRLLAVARPLADLFTEADLSAARAAPQRRPTSPG